MNEKQRQGRVGEEFAVNYLHLCLGWAILQRNWRCVAGEFDIIAQDADCLVVVEVRTRRSVDAGTVIEAVDERKVRQLQRVMRFFLNEFPGSTDASAVRVDVIALNIERSLVCELMHVRDALATTDAVWLAGFARGGY